MVTKVDDEARHKDLPDLQDEFDTEVKNLERRRDNEIEERAKKVEADLAELDAEGEVKQSAKTKLRNGAERDRAAIRQRYDDQIARLGAVFDKFKTLKPGDMENDVRNGAERDMAASRQRYDDQIARLGAVYDKFKNLKPGDMENDVDLWREMEDRNGDYFEGSKGAEESNKRLQDLDFAQTMKSAKRLVDRGDAEVWGVLEEVISMGRILFNETLPVDCPCINEQAPKGKLSKIVDDIATRYSTQQVGRRGD